MLWEWSPLSHKQVSLYKGDLWATHSKVGNPSLNISVNIQQHRGLHSILNQSCSIRGSILVEKGSPWYSPWSTGCAMLPMNKQHTGQLTLENFLQMCLFLWPRNPWTLSTTTTLSTFSWWPWHFLKIFQKFYLSKILS